jgi:ketosteroid isomerase-like protein
MGAPENAELIARFYAAMDRGDGGAMAACYAADARFEDPAFGELTGVEAGAMWRMLTSRATGLRVELAEHETAADWGSARWIARYTFGQTGRRVTNDIRARFRFDEDGRIAEHVDEFDFWRWARQALGPPGLLLGWTPMLRRKVGAQARTQLERFMADEPSA